MNSKKIFTFISVTCLLFLVLKYVFNPTPQLSKINLAFISNQPLAGKIKSPYGLLELHYTIDARLQQNMIEIFRRSKIPYGALVAIDAYSGKILALVSHGSISRDLNLSANFPAASIFKVITAAAALHENKLEPHSLIPVQGRYHTLYKRNIFKGGGLGDNQPAHDIQKISFSDALAKSVNSVFGKIGIFGVGPQNLRNMAARFQFDTPIPFELPLDTSHAPISDDPFELAETASGFTKRTTLSPLHGALIAATISNNGVMMEPAIVSHILNTKGAAIYTFQPKPLEKVLSPEISQKLALMMNRTIVAGTSRSAFRGLTKNTSLSNVFIGGKTGSLNGWDPAGKVDWFIGFAKLGHQNLALAALCIHTNQYGIKASQLARVAFETYFGSKIAQK